MLKISIFMILIIAISILDKLYLLPLNPSLNTIPNNKRSATYLAKSIAKSAQCHNVYLDDVNDDQTIFKFDCNFGFTDKNTYTPFFIYIFLDTKIKDTWINKRIKNSSRDHKRCSKEGNAYVICDISWSPTIILQEKEKKAISPREKYYQQFPGEPIEYKRD